MSFDRHRPLRGASWQDVAEARALLRQGLTLREAACELDIISRDLDQLLWAAIKWPDGFLPHRRPEAMF